MVKLIPQGEKKNGGVGILSPSTKNQEELQTKFHSLRASTELKAVKKNIQNLTVLICVSVPLDCKHNFMPCLFK